MPIQNAEQAFTRQAPFFDSIEEHNEILKWMRHRVHHHCMLFYKPGEKILELNCGTGIDAIFFANQGLSVLATDISEGMLNQLRSKLSGNSLAENISIQRCSFQNLGDLSQRSFHHIFSDFGGLNCTPDLKNVIAQFDELLVPGGTVTLVLMPPICPWEILLALKGNFRIAFRRLKKKSMSHLEGEYFMTYYYSAGEVTRMFGRNFEVEMLASLASLVPPPYLENFSKKFPKLFHTLCSLEVKFSSRFPLNRWADHFILTMRKSK